MRSLQSDAIARGTTDTFQLNRLILSLFSVAGFLFIHYYAAQRRLYGFALLRSMGLAPGQMLRLLGIEGILTVGIGILAGTVIGYGLTRTTLPYLLQSLSASIGRVEIRRIVVDWPALFRLYAILTVGYLLALGSSLLALRRSGQGSGYLSEE
jgi:ABC-type lipoprotein release transport system permease subunit